MVKSYKGKYRVKNPKKYKGNHLDCVYRSLKERQVMVYCDSCPEIEGWGSETVVVRYLYEVDNKVHRYFTDFYVEIRTKSGELRKMILEYKPFSQTKPPQQSKKNPNHWKKRKRFVTEQLTYIKNRNKWSAANQWAKDNGMDFYVITEKDTKDMKFFKEFYRNN